MSVDSLAGEERIGVRNLHAIPASAWYTPSSSRPSTSHLSYNPNKSSPTSHRLEIREILIRHIDIRTPAQLAVQPQRLLPARESVLVELVLDLLIRIRHEDRRVGVTRAHFAAGALEGSQELRVGERGFGGRGAHA